MLYINDNKYELAYDYLIKAINLNPNYSKAYNNLGALYFKIKDYKQALHCFDKAFKLDKNLLSAGIQKYFIKRLFCDWSDEAGLKSLLIDTTKSDELVSPWFCLSMEDNINNAQSDINNDESIKSFVKKFKGSIKKDSIKPLK